MLNEHEILAGSPPTGSDTEVKKTEEDKNDTEPEWK